jgi:hypothetical protein
MVCKRKYCQNEIPVARHANAEYCSLDCYVLAKKQRDKKSYQQMSKRYKQIKHNEDILVFFSRIEGPFPVKYFEEAGFDFDIFDYSYWPEDSTIVIYEVNKMAYYYQSFQGKQMIRVLTKKSPNSRDYYPVHFQ